MTDITEMKIEELNVEERRKRILDMLNRDGKVRVVDLSRLFGISEVTARSDLDSLEAEGLLERVHGGAVSTYKSYYSMTFLDRLEANKEEKRKIAARAASMISDGDTVMLSSGTTPLYVARELKDKRNLIVVTNSISVAQELGYNKNVNVVVLLGGNINPLYQFTYGDDTINQLKRYKADKLILSSDGVSSEFGVTTYHHLESEMNRQMIARVNKTIVVADYTKIGRAGFSHIEAIERIDCLVTNASANKDELAAFRDRGLEIHLV